MTERLEIELQPSGDRQLLARLRRIDPSVLAVSSDGSYYAAAVEATNASGGIRIALTDSGRTLTSLQFCNENESVTDIAFAPDRERIVIGTSLGDVRLFYFHSGKVSPNIVAHFGPVNAVTWNRTGTRFATAGEDGTAKLYEAETGRILQTNTKFRGALRGIAFGKDGASLVLSDAARVLYIWPLDAATRRVSPDPSGPPSGFARRRLLESQGPPAECAS